MLLLAIAPNNVGSHISIFAQKKDNTSRLKVLQYSLECKINLANKANSLIIKHSSLSSYKFPIKLNKKVIQHFVSILSEIS